MTRRKKILSFTCATLVVFASGVAWTMRAREKGPREFPTKAVLLEEIVAPGIVEPATSRIELSFEVSGRIESVAVKEGDKVTAGQILATLDDGIARARVARAEALLGSIEAKRDRVFRGARKEAIRALEADVEAARAHAWEREQWYARAKELVSTKSLSRSDFDQAKGTADAGRANAAAAEARLETVRQGATIEDKREARAAVAAAKAELEEARAFLAYTTLRAPLSGVILRRAAEPGELVVTTPPKVALILADLDHLELRTEIDEADVGRVEIGQRAYATANAYGARHIDGQIRRIQRELGRKTLALDDPRSRVDTRVLEVIFVPDRQEELPLGLRMDVHLDAATRDPLGMREAPMEASLGRVH